MEPFLTNVVDILTILSNLALLIPFVSALKQHRWTRAFIFFWMTWVSFIYHLCDSFGACLFRFTVHHNLDFFFAELLIILTVLYFVEFSSKYPWVERFLIILGAIAVIILQVVLDNELHVQAVIVGFSVGCLIIYWIVYAYTYGDGHIPHYYMPMLALGVSLISGSIILYEVQGLWPAGYWGIHSLWHVMAALGQHYFLFIKVAAISFYSVDSRIRFKY